MRFDGFGVEIDAGGQVVDCERDGFVEAGFTNDKELGARSSTLADESCLAGKGFVLLMRVPGDRDEPVTGGDGENTELGRSGMTELIEEGEAVFSVGGWVETDGGVGGANGEMATA